MWEDIVKGLTQYTGTCPKCGEFFPSGVSRKKCPENLPPAKSSHIQNIESCPMKVKQVFTEMEKAPGAFTTGSAPGLFKPTYGGRRKKKKEE